MTVQSVGTNRDDGVMDLEQERIGAVKWLGALLGSGVALPPAVLFPWIPWIFR